MSENNEEQNELLAAEEKTTATVNLPKQQPEESNQKYVVPFGILSVILALYLTISTVKQTFGLSEPKLSEESKQLEKLQFIKTELPLEGEKELSGEENLLIKEKLLEHYNKCYDLEIFTKPIDWPENENELENDRFSSISESKTREEKKKGHEVNKKKLFLSAIKSDRNGKGQKRLNGKNNNGLKYNNKSSKAQNGRPKVSHKTDVNQKKGSTAEPIIYVFALVFIYLLLKAASDINQHYKSQSKGDKRLRRCSLQSYAQAHKPDRRASKESPVKAKKALETRSISVDRYCSDAQLTRKNDILMQLRKCTSVDEQQQQLIDSLAWNSNMMDIRNIEISKERMESFMPVIQRRDSMFTLPASSNRRCSVPVSMNYQRLKLTTTPSIALSTTTRRTSISSGSMGTAGSVESVDLQFPEVKRRVRMINRH